MRRSLFWVAVYAITFLISSCASLSTSQPPAQSAPSWEERKLALNRIQHWNLNGKIGIQTATDSGSAFVKWQENYPRYTISLYGPIGAAAMELTGQPGLVTLKHADGKSFSAPNTAQLLAQQTGWHLPVENLYYWIRGLPVPGVAYQSQFDSENRLTTLNQQIQFSSYVNTGSVDLPNKITLDSSDFHAKIVVQSWEGLV